MSNVEFNRKDIGKWFEESLEQIWSLIEKQIKVCEEQRLNIQVSGPNPISCLIQTSYNN